MTDPTPTELIARAKTAVSDADRCIALSIQPSSGSLLRPMRELIPVLEAQLAETARLQAELTRRDTMIAELRERQTGLVRIVAAATPVPAKSAGSSSALEAVKAAVWDEARSSLIDRFMTAVNEDGYIDQHVIAIGGAKIANPYRPVEAEGESRG